MLSHPSNYQRNSVVFPSRVNYGSDYGYIEYRDDDNDSGEAARLTIGTSNDADDDVVIDPSGRLQIAATNATLDTSGNMQIDGDLTVSGASTNFRNAIKAVDGSSSGIDADLLDGISSGSFLRSNANDNLTAAIIVPTGNRDEGIFGTYDSTKTQHIWSMGTSYRNAADGSSFGNLYGLAYKYNGAAGGHGVYLVNNGVAKVGLGTGIWTSGTVTAADFSCSDCINAGDLAANACGNSELIDIPTFTTVNGVSSNSYDKLRVWGSSSYAIGMYSAQTYGGLNDYAMTFTMNADADRGFLWRDSSDSASDGAMSLTTAGVLTVKGTVTAPGFFYSSDRRLKKNVHNIETPLEKILALDGVSFQWKEDDRNDIGLIAQDVEKIFPEIVKTDKQTGLKYIIKESRERNRRTEDSNE